MVAPIHPRRPLFPLGRVVATPGALHALERSGESPTAFLSRHQQGDWGDVCSEDGRLNDRAVVGRSRILSAYRTTAGDKLWVITEEDWSTTTLLLPHDY